MTRFVTRFAALVIVVLIPTIAWPQSNFTDPIYIKTPQQGTFPVSGDFNGDSKTDLAYWTSEPDFDLYVWYNQGDHNFTKSVYSTDGIANLRGLEVGDFNGDGKDDMVSFEGPTLILFTSTGTSWTQSTITTSQSGIESIQLVNFDSDDHLDIVAAFSSNVIAYKGDGTGAFTSTTETGITGLRSFRYADLNNDDLMDFIGLNNSTLKIFLKDPAGYTASEKILADLPFDFEVADFDADESPDVAISFSNSTYGKIEIFKNAGNGTFPTSQSIAVGQQPFLLAHADYDNDGREDLAASSFNTPSVIILNNTLGGFVSLGPTQTKSNASTGIIFADMDGDDVEELVELRSQEINIYARTVFNDFTLDQTIILALFASSGIVADMNNDGYNDIVAPSSNAVSVQYGHGDFTFDAPVYTHAVGDFQLSILVGYFDNDEFRDVIYTGAGETGIMRSDNGILKEPEIIFGGSLISLASADFNNDGHMDFAGQDYVMLGDGAGGFTQEYTELGVGISSTGVGYFNNDTRPDLIMTSFDGIAYIALNSGTTPMFPVFEVIPDVVNQPLMVTTKFNDDDLTDFVVGGSFVKNFSVLVNDGDGTFTKKDITLGSDEGVFAAMPSFADFDNDGRTDVAVPYSNIPANGGIGIFMQDANGNLNFKDKIDFDPVQAPGYAMLGDLNGDHEIDIVGLDLNSRNAVTIVPSLYEPKEAAGIGVISVTGTSVKLTVPKGDGTGRIVFIRGANETRAIPVDNVVYTDNTVFGSGTGPTNSIFAVAKGDITEVTVTGLARNTTYFATAHEYNENVAHTMIDYIPNVSETQVITKKEQVITISNPGNIVMGNSSFTIFASSSSTLPVTTFEALTPNISVSGSIVTPQAPGPAKVKASQAGNEEFDAASAEVTFCVNPAVPKISIEDRFGGKYLLTSSYESDNQWLFNGTAVAGATSRTFEPTQDGVYSVKVDFSGCTSTSSPTNYLITGLEEIAGNIVIYPNPVRDIVTIQTGSLAINSSDVLFTDATGRQHFFNGRQEGSNRLTVNIASTLVRGLYVIEVQTNIGAVRKKVVID